MPWTDIEFKGITYNVSIPKHPKCRVCKKYYSALKSDLYPYIRSHDIICSRKCFNKMYPLVDVECSCGMFWTCLALDNDHIQPCSKSVNYREKRLDAHQKNLCECESWLHIAKDHTIFQDKYTQAKAYYDQRIATTPDKEHEDIYNDLLDLKCGFEDIEDI